MTIEIRIGEDVGGFAEDKDRARRLRVERVLPALEDGEPVTLDFANVSYATQSFVHALVGEPLKKFGEAVLDRIEFKNCSGQLRTVIELVVDYSLGGFDFDQTPGVPDAADPREGRKARSR
jgi:hypothetical protein